MHAGLLAALAVAIVNFSWRLGASSLFVDEVASWHASNSSIGTLLHLVRVVEVAPPGYYLLLHLWLSIFGSDSETVMRSLSVVAAVGLVTAIYWVGNLLGGRVVAFVAAMLAALSPLVLEYGQEVRAYGWTMLVVTVAVGGALQAEQSPRHRTQWLTLAAVTSIASVWLHYSAGLVIGPLLVFVARSASLTKRQRLCFVGAVVVGAVGVLPILVAQLQTGNQNAIAPVAQFSYYNLRRVVGAPFDRTYPLISATNLTLGAVLIVVALGVLLLPHARARIRHPPLLAALASLAPLVLIALTAAGKHELISRYDAVAVPFMALALAATLTILPAAGIIIVLLAVMIALPASRLAHHAETAYPNTREAVRFVARTWQPGEVLVIGNGYPGYGGNLQYYAQHLLPPKAAVGYNLGLKLLVWIRPMKRITRIGLITYPLGSIGQVTANLAKLGWRAIAAELVPGTIPMQAFTAVRQTSRRLR